MPPGTASGKRLLCEGWIEEGCQGAAVFLPEFAYVRQGSKVWIAYGDRKRLDESAPDMQIVERIDEMELEERTLSTGATVKLPKGGKWMVEGPAQRSDVKNANQRVYPRKLWEKLIGDKKSYVQEQIRARAMIGHLEHPKDGRTDLNESSIITTEATLQEDGTVWNKFEILDTPKGLILQELTLKGVRWGVSSRGNGTVDDAGMVSESDYVLKTWDAVAAPSTPGAYAKLSEDKNTEESAQGALSGRAKASLEALKILVESESDGLDRKGQAQRADGLLRVLSSIDEATATELLRNGQSWAEVQRAVERSRELIANVQTSDKLDEAIEQALDSGETSEARDGLLHVVESLQAQVEESVTETTALRGRLEVAESAARELQAVHEEALEQLSQIREELARTKRKHDLTCELLAEATARPDGDRRADAKVDEMVAKRPTLKPYRNVLMEAARVGQADELAERLDPQAPARKEEPPAHVFASRSSLPAGIVESLDAPPSRVASANVSEGARLAGRVVPGAQKQRT